MYNWEKKYEQDIRKLVRLAAKVLQEEFKRDCNYCDKSGKRKHAKDCLLVKLKKAVKAVKSAGR